MKTPASQIVLKRSSAKWASPVLGSAAGERLAPVGDQDHLDGQKAVLYRSRMNPSLGRNFEAMDPLEWLARLADHIPDPANIAPTSMGTQPRARRAAIRGTGTEEARGGATPEAPLPPKPGAAHAKVF